MLLILIVGWVVVLPTLVVGGLLLASSILGRRARRTGVIDATGFAREIGRLSANTPEARKSPAPERGRVGAAY